MLSNIHIENTPISNFTENLVTSLDSLILINNNLSLFQKNNLAGVDTLTIINSPNLKYVELDNLYQLKKLRLEGLPVPDFKSGASLDNVTELYLKNNLIKIIDTSKMVKL